MDEGDRADAVLAPPEDSKALFIFDVGHLQPEKARYDLEVILDPVMYLLQQGLLFMKRCPDLLFCRRAHDDHRLYASLTKIGIRPYIQ